MKATSIFGGVQVFQILIAIIKSKFIAILLGPKGMGIAELLRSTIQMVSTLTNMGIGTSAVKNIASANAKNDQMQISTTVMVLRRIVWATGMLGAIMILVLAPWLSKLTFGNDEFTFAFRWLSITLLLNQLFTGQIVVLQGLRKLEYLAKANIIGSSIGLLISIPVYYAWGINGIVSVMIISSLIALIVSYYFSKKIKINPVSVSKQVTLDVGKSIMGMGIMLSLNGFLKSLEAYFVRIYINLFGNLEDVGLFTAGFAIIGVYTSMVLSAMGTDYYPRLSGVIENKSKTNLTVNQQAEIAILILAPLMALFIIFIKWGIILVYSSKFLQVTEMIQWAALGILFKATGWSMGFIFLAKGDSKVVFWNSLGYRVYFFLLNILGYKYFGLTGLGISFLIAFILGFIQNLIVTSILYGFKFEREFGIIFGLQFTIVLLCFLTIQIFKAPWIYLIGLIFIIISILYSLNELDKRLDLKAIFKFNFVKTKKE